jgi:hypothetical protein
VFLARLYIGCFNLCEDVQSNLTTDPYTLVIREHDESLEMLTLQTTLHNIPFVFAGDNNPSTLAKMDGSEKVLTITTFYYSALMLSKYYDFGHWTCTSFCY